MNLNDEINNKAISWILSESEGLNHVQKKELELWLENKLHKKAYDENKKILHDCTSLDEDFINELENEALSLPKQNNFFNKYKYLVASFAAIFIAFFSFSQYKKSFEPSFEKSFLSTNEKILNINLPDSSTIDLDIKSELKIAFYKDKRALELTKGKALFSVAKDKKRPFIIKTSKTVVEVLGTKFEVEALDDITKVNVLEGVVKVGQVYNNRGDVKNLVVLNKAEVFAINNSGKVLDYSKKSPQRMASWKEDLIKFEKQTLKEAFSLFQRYSNSKVEFETYELSQYKITGSFSTKNYDGFLTSIEHLYPIKIKKEKNFIKITKK